MRKIGLSEIEDIALGASLLGAGGGGDPYVGKLVAIGAVRECGPVTLLEPDEVPDDALVMPIAMMGAPTVLAEKAIGGNEYKKLFDMVSKFFGREIYAFMPIEADGVTRAYAMEIPVIPACEDLNAGEESFVTLLSSCRKKERKRGTVLTVPTEEAINAVMDIMHKNHII